MAKIRKYKLSWVASDSKNVIGYKLYCSKATEVNYDSKYITVGNVAEIKLPYNVLLSDRPVIFGITAIDKDGNESDMIKMSEPFQLHVPKAPVSITLIPLDEFNVLDSKKVVRTSLEHDDNDDPLADAIEFHGKTDRQK